MAKNKIDFSKMSLEEKAAWDEAESLRLKKKKEANIRCYAKKMGITVEEYLKLKPKRVVDNPPDYDSLIKTTLTQYKPRLPKPQTPESIEQLFIWRLTKIKAFFILKDKFANNDDFIKNDLKKYMVEYEKTLNNMTDIRAKKIWEDLIKTYDDSEEAPEADIKTSDIKNQIRQEVEALANEMILASPSVIVPEEIFNTPLNQFKKTLYDTTRGNSTI